MGQYQGIPWTFPVIHVRSVDNLEPRSLDRAIHLREPGNLFQSNSKHELVLDRPVNAVVGIEPFGHAHLLTPQQGSGFQDTEDFRKRARFVRCVARRLDRITCIEGVGFDHAHIHEVAIDVLCHVIEPRLDVSPLGLFQLLYVIVDADNPGAAFAGDPPHGTAHSAADIGNHHALPQFQLFDHQALMTNERLLQRFLACQWCKVQGLAPSELHEFAAQVIVFVDCLNVVVIYTVGITLAHSVKPIAEARNAHFDVRALINALQGTGQTCQHAPHVIQ